MNLIYTFSKKLNHTWLDRTLELYKKSYKINSKFHDIILYTDLESKELLDDTFNNIRIIDTSDVIFFDDLKFKVLKECTMDDVLCDGDLFLNRRLFLNHNYDVLYDTFVEIKNTIHYDFYEYYRNTSNTLIENGINGIIPFYNNNVEKVINIGLLWFKNLDKKNQFLDYYFLQRDWVLNSGLEETYKFTSDFKNGITFSQYFLSIYVNEFKLKSKSFKEYCDYNHYSGSEKYYPDFMKRFETQII